MSPFELTRLLAGAQAPEENWRKAFRLCFAQLRTEVDIHPVASTAAATFEAASQTARIVSAECLPLGIGLVMHLYPLCALRCVPLPWWSPANYRRQRLLREIDRHSLILANAGSERAAGAHAPVKLTRTPDGVLVDGRYDYVSLANVADLVLFGAPLSGSHSGDNSGSLFCIADLRTDTVHVGAPRFSGSMKLSDTCSVTFEKHFLPPDRFVDVPSESALGCLTRYQRSWFQLLSGEAHLARIDYLQRLWKLPRATEQTASRNELALLREYAKRLLDEAALPGAVEKLSQVTAAMKLRISWMAQSTAALMQSLDKTAADELLFIKRQPTSDDRILRSLVAADTDRFLASEGRSWSL